MGKCLPYHLSVFIEVLDLRIERVTFRLLRVRWAIVLSSTTQCWARSPFHCSLIKEEALEAIDSRRLCTPLSGRAYRVVVCATRLVVVTTSSLRMSWLITTSNAFEIEVSDPRLVRRIFAHLAGVMTARMVKKSALGAGLHLM